MFRPGSVRKIEVRNFVTYTHVELYPGPKLNMLIGPNGTGKSTIVAAIILGLGGNPKVVGRGTKISEYIKHNTDEAIINLHLQGEQERKYIKITRKITKQDKSIWLLNNCVVNLKEIYECIKQYNIQIDNLCQTLPQDRVQEFAKMNQQQLLKEIQRALCRDDLFETQEALIKTREKQLNLGATIENIATKLQVAVNVKQRLEGRVQNFKKKNEYFEQINGIDRKLAWLQFDQVYAKIHETKEEVKKVSNIYEKHKAAYKPFQANIQKAKELVAELQNESGDINRKIKHLENLIRFNLEQLDGTYRDINTAKSEMNIKLSEIEEKQKEIETSVKKIDEMKVAQSALMERCENDNSIQHKVATFSTEIQKLTKHINGLKNKKEEINDSRQNRLAELRACEQQIGHLENVKEKRLNQLQRLDQNAYQATLWLRENKHLFKGQVFEPIMLEVNVLETKNAKFLENVIARRDLVAFSCTQKDDMSLLIKHLRTEKGLSVNIVHLDETTQTHFLPSVPIEQLRKFGFYHYLNSLFLAPVPIMNYLCKTYRVYQIPVGNDNVNNCYYALPKEITLFFSENIRYSVRYSKYTGERSVQQNEIQPSGTLSISIDLLRVESLKGKIGELNSGLRSTEEDIKVLENQINSINGKIIEITTELNQLRQVKTQIDSLQTRIGMMKTRVDQMRKNLTTPQQIKQKTDEKISKIIIESKKKYEKLLASYKSLSKLTPKKLLILFKTIQARKRVITLENQAEETEKLVREAETTLNQIKEVYNNIKVQAKSVLAKAKSLSNNFLPEDAGFKVFREEYDRLSSNPDNLNKEKDALLAKIGCLSTADQDEINEYQASMEEIEQLEADLERYNSELIKVTTTMEKLELEWLTPLKEFLKQIHLKFATAFERMGCAGEVSLNTGDDDKNYSMYGLCIKVTYRNGEPLQELNNVVQSGGERAVATAAFMLSIQELTPVPFRCVDEINQGMDAENERRIFDLIIETTDQNNASQYFLITPKLVPNLKFSKTQIIHFVHNGPFIEQDKKWTFSKFCNPGGMQVY